MRDWHSYSHCTCVCVCVCVCVLLPLYVFRYMNDVESNGVGGDSPLESPQHPQMRDRAHAQVAQGESVKHYV